MKKLLVIGIVAVMVMSATAAMAAFDNDWLLAFKVSSDNLAKGGASQATFGMKTAAGDTFANFSPAANLAGFPEINYSDAAHAYTADYNVTTNKRYYVAKFGGVKPAPTAANPIIAEWKFRACGAAGTSVYVSGWNYTGTASTFDAPTGADAGNIMLKLFEADADGNKVGAAIYTFQPGKVSTLGASGLSGAANVDYFSKQYTLGAADAAGGAYKYFVLDYMQVPEPGSMVALLSGLVGLVGFGIRRRK